MAQINPQQIQYQIEHIQDSRRSDVVFSSVLMITLTTTAVALRLVVRKLKKIPFWWDDWLCLIALPISISGAILCLSDDSLGQHFLALSPSEIKRYLKMLYAAGISYRISIVLVKLSILVFYRRVFPMAHVSRAWRICWWVLFVFSSLMIVMTIPGIFQCRPIAFFWDRTIAGGQCSVHRVPFFIYTSIINILSDVSILILPLPVLSKLQMAKSKKLGLIGLFLLGGFVCVASIVRTTYLKQFAAEDPTWTQVDAAIWSFVEPTTALICACLPVLVPPFCAQIVAFTSSIYLSLRRSKGNKKGSTITIGQQGIRPRIDRKSFAKFGVGKEIISVSEVEMTGPIVDNGGFKNDMSAEKDLEKCITYHAGSVD